MTEILFLKCNKCAGELPFTLTFKTDLGVLADAFKDWLVYPSLGYDCPLGQCVMHPLCLPTPFLASGIRSDHIIFSSPEHRVKF